MNKIITIIFLNVNERDYWFFFVLLLNLLIINLEKKIANRKEWLDWLMEGDRNATYLIS